MLAAAAALLAFGPTDRSAALLRVMTRMPAGSRHGGHLLVMTLGGPVYCGQAVALARFLDATLVCPDFGPNRERSGASRVDRMEDWGNPRYLDAVARLPGRLIREGVKVSGLVLVGASYAGYAAAELAATHPGLHPRAVIVVDSFLDLRTRFDALQPGQLTRDEMLHVLGGTPAEYPRTYARRSPSTHLAGLAAATDGGRRLIDVWSVAPDQNREFNGAMCSKRANAFWLQRLAAVAHRPVRAYVTELPHAYALWDWWRQLLSLAGLATTRHPLPATAVTFSPGRRIPAASYCGPLTSIPGV